MQALVYFIKNDDIYKGGIFSVNNKTFNHRKSTVFIFILFT